MSYTLLNQAKDTLLYTGKYLNCIDIINLSQCNKYLNKVFKSKCKIIRFGDIQVCATHDYPNKHLVECLKTLIECPFDAPQYHLYFYTREAAELTKYLIMLLDYDTRNNVNKVSKRDISPDILYNIVIFKNKSLEDEHQRYLEILNTGNVPESLEFRYNWRTVVLSKKMQVAETKAKLAGNNLYAMCNCPQCSRMRNLGGSNIYIGYIDDNIGPMILTGSTEYYRVYDKFGFMNLTAPLGPLGLLGYTGEVKKKELNIKIIRATEIARRKGLIKTDTILDITDKLTKIPYYEKAKYKRESKHNRSNFQKNTKRNTPKAVRWKSR
jgi:hypothetical protein